MYSKLKSYFFSEFSTNKKILNFLLAGFQWKFKFSTLTSYPISLMICPGNICNLHCVLCPTGQNEKGRVNGFMKFDIFKKVIDECGPYLYNLELYNWGEPFLNKEIFRMAKYAKKYKIKISVSTNLLYFNEQICLELIESGIDYLLISLDGTTQKTVSTYQIGNDFDTVITNMKKLIKTKRELKTTKPFIDWGFRVGIHNQHELETGKALAEEIGVDKFTPCSFRCDMGKELLLNGNQQYDNVKKWLTKDELISRKQNIKSDCKWLWLRSVINWNGSVSPCCAVWYEKFDFGNINKSSFQKIWNNSKYQEARKIISGKIDSCSENICFICKKNGAIL